MPDINISGLALLLFLPADRTERYSKAFGAGADAVILDLEDGVAPDRKDQARAALVGQRAAIAAAGCPVLVRINASGSADQPTDIAAIANLPLAAVMLSKAESATGVAALAKATGRAVLALIESAKGVAAAREIAGTGARLAFGSIDYAADLGCAHTRQALLMARAELVSASRLAGIAPPLDGVGQRERQGDLLQPFNFVEVVLVADVLEGQTPCSICSTSAVPSGLPKACTSRDGSVNIGPSALTHCTCGDSR